MSTLRFLLLEDKTLDTKAIQARLTDGGIDYELLRVDTRADFVTALETQVFDLILAAYAMPGFDGMAALEIAGNLSPNVPFIFVSANLGEELAIETLKRGATDYVLKQRLERLVPCVQRAVQEAQERRERQAALRDCKKTEQERERFLSVGSDLQVITGSKGYFQWVSPTFERVLGWTPDEMIARPWIEFVHPDDIGASVSETDSLFSGSETFAFENRYRHKDGSYRWLLWRAQPYPEEQVIYGVAVDITKAKHSEAVCKQAEADLRAREARLRFMLDASQIGEWDLDLTTQPHTAHRSLRHDQIFGYESLLPEWSYEIFLTHVHPDDRAAVNEQFQQTLSASTSWNFECRIIQPDQSVHWIEARSSVYCDQSGTPTRLLGMVVDITERKQVETALQESEARLRLALKTGKLGSWQLDLKTNQLFTSDQCKANYGFSPGADFTHQALLNRIHPDDRAWVQAAIEQAIEQQTDYDVEYRTVWDDGSIHWALVRGCTVYDADGTPLQMVGMSLDISDRKQAEESLQQSEEQIRNILESINDGFFALDEDWRFTYVNQAAERLTDRTAAELLGKNFWEEFPGVAGSEFEQLHYRAMYDRVAGSVTAFYPDHDRWYAVHSYPAAQGITAYFRDVTAQMQAEAALRSSHDTFRYLVENSPFGVYVVDADFRLAQVSAGAQKVFENVCPLIGRDFAEVLRVVWPEPFASEAIARFRHTLETGEPYHAPSTIKRRHDLDEVESYDWKIERIALPDGRFGAVCHFYDLSEREQLLQREQAAREEAERANRIKDEFLAVLSHELRSPLNPILGWSRLLQTGKLDVARQTEALATIERNARLQSQLIEDLLDISRIMQGKLTLTPAPISLTFVISAAVDTVRLAAEAKHIQIALDLDPEIAPISGDAARLQQVVWNLLTNAVKFTPNGGQVTVELRQIDRLAQIRVIDTGKGVAPDFLPHVFEYFRQEDGSTTRKFGGLGLGLAIVRQIVEMHGGTVRAASQGENQGATFIVQLPTMQQAASIVFEPARTQADTKAPLDNIQILLVDDDNDTREFQAFLLEQSGAKVIAVASGLEALQVLDRLIFDVIVSDVGMAEMDGYMLMQQIRSRPLDRGGMIPAIALTAYARQFDQQQAIAAGFQAHLTKPVEPENLIGAIINLLQEKILLLYS